MRKNRKPVALLLACTMIVLLAVLAASCAPAGDDEIAASHEGGRIRLDFYSPTQLDPSIGWQSMNLRAFGVLQTLLWIDQNNELQYELATDIATLSPTEFHVKLRSNVKFHDGTDMDSADVVYSFRRVLDPESPRSAEFSAIESVEAIDPMTVLIRTKEPFAPLRACLAETCFSIIPEGYADFSQSIVGTGPFRLTEWESATMATVDRFDDYWGGKPFLEGADIVQVDDELTKTYKLLNNEIDIAYGSVPPAEIESVLADPNLAISTRISEKRILLFNTAQKPFDSKEARKGLSYVINKQELVNLALGDNGGVAAIGDWFMLVDSWANISYQKHDQDLDRARELFAIAGVSDSDNDGVLDFEGIPVEIDLITYSVAGFDYPAQIIQSQLQNFGFKVNLHILEYAVAQEKIANGDFTLSFRDMGYFDGEPSLAYNYMYGEDGLASGLGGYVNEELYQMLNEGMKRQEHSERKEVYDAISDKVLDDLPLIYLYYVSEQRAYNTRVHGFINYPNETLLTNTIYLDGQVN
jgi:peptide/nickel transport system substrate-binding protein